MRRDRDGMPLPERPRWQSVLLFLPTMALEVVLMGTLSALFMGALWLALTTVHWTSGMALKLVFRAVF